MGYIGGKSKISKFIIPKIPKDIEIYCEPFAGMNWNFLKMDLTKYPYLKTIVYNDYNGLNSNLFKCAKDYTRLLDEMKKYPYQQKGEFPTPPIYAEKYLEYQKEIFADNVHIGTEPNFEIACKYIYVLAQGFSGSNPRYANFMALHGKYECKITAFLNKMKNPYYQNQLDRITAVENMDYKDVIAKYDSPTTYFYCDPPYNSRKFENLYTNHNFGAVEHFRLSQVLDTILGKFALSYYRFPEMHEYYPPDYFTYYEELFKKGGTAQKGHKQNEATEILITNY